jgi:GMP synthase-like glutamine amidotransferase
MRVLVTQHHAHAGQSIPRDQAILDMILSLGGPMNVYEEAEHSWLIAKPWARR